MITSKDKQKTALTEARRHILIAQLADNPIIAKGHEDVAKIFEAIADDYTEIHNMEQNNGT